jgi:hypothetical protein
VKENGQLYEVSSFACWWFVQAAGRRLTAAGFERMRGLFLSITE